MMGMINIPQPKPLPFLGNMLQLKTDKPVQKLTQLALNYGEIYLLEMPFSNLIILTSQSLVNEICDEERFQKKVHQSLVNLKSFGGNGLFTADTNDPEWQKAHRVLLPAFTGSSLKNLMPAMTEIADQFIHYWETSLAKSNHHLEVDLPGDMTKLTLDTIALTSFDYHFKSFENKRLHPFVDAMFENLTEAARQLSRPKFLQAFYNKFNHQFINNTRFMHELADDIIQKRIKENEQGNALDKKDLLHLMLNSLDPITGERLSDKNIRYQLITFLIAGHETTSGLLSFAIYELIRHPEIAKKMRIELDQVLQGRTPTFSDLHQLKYLECILKETLRLWPTAPAFAMRSIADETLLAGKYKITKDDTLMVILPGLHQDEKVWKNPKQFLPERMEPEKFRDLPSNSWKPFGHGQRSCIGRGFAMQESMLILAMIYQKFDLSFADPDYQLQIKETLTMKPQDLRLKVCKRVKV